jgi:hypothetical protein
MIVFLVSETRKREWNEMGIPKAGGEAGCQDGLYNDDEAG